MNFRRYQHIERINTPSTEGLLDGKCYIFYKLDGTNGSVWLRDNKVICGSRNRELTLENDNAGFYNDMLKNYNVRLYLEKYPDRRLFGEWLVPHSFKDYRESAWGKFYVFDVAIDKGDDELEYLSYENYYDELFNFEIDYIHPLAIIKNPTVESLYKCLEKSGEFLVKDGTDIGEGIVIKNYGYVNPYGKQIWGKIISTEFREQHKKTMGSPEITVANIIEEKVVNEYCTEAFIEKEFSKIVLNHGAWESKYIGELLGRVYHELLREEMVNIVVKYKNPTINYRMLNNLIVSKIKEVKKDLF